jgi:multidrug efflux pump subunit AcrA (membrane-fusion protein)
VTLSENVAKAFYEVTIEPESFALGKKKNRCFIQLGMEGRADIITREDTVLKFLLRKARLSADL